MIRILPVQSGVKLGNACLNRFSVLFPCVYRSFFGSALYDKGQTLAKKLKKGELLVFCQKRCFGIYCGVKFGEIGLSFVGICGIMLSWK